MRRYAEENGMDEEDALQAGMKEKADEFRSRGGEVYLEETAS